MTRVSQQVPFGLLQEKCTFPQKQSLKQHFQRNQTKEKQKENPKQHICATVSTENALAICTANGVRTVQRVSGCTASTLKAGPSTQPDCCRNVCLW